MCAIKFQLSVHKLREITSPKQWRIQDFPEEGAPTPDGGGGCQPIIWPTVPKNCMKMKIFWAEGGGGRVPLIPPLQRCNFHIAFFQPDIHTVKNGFHSIQWMSLHMPLKYVRKIKGTINENGLENAVT